MTDVTEPTEIPLIVSVDDHIVEPAHLWETWLPARFKGGWGPGTQPGSGGAWLDRQMGTIEIDGRPVVLAIATSGTDHASGTVTLTKLAAWATDHVDPSSAPSAPVCR